MSHPRRCRVHAADDCNRALVEEGHTNNPTREKILMHGLDVLSVSGFSGVTLGVLAQRGGMSKSGLYAHFRSIEQVHLALLGKMGELWDAYVVLPSMSAEEGVPRLRSYFVNSLEWTTKAGMTGGNPLFAAMYELDDIPGALRSAVIASAEDWRDTIMEHARQAIHAGDLHADTDIVQLAWELRGIALSHHVSRRLFRDSQADGRAQLALDRLIENARSHTKTASAPA